MEQYYETARASAKARNALLQNINAAFLVFTV
jgi:hypothetical protein